MSSETKGTEERHIVPTSFEPQNPLRARREMGQHLQRSQADIHAYFWNGNHVKNTCGSKQANGSQVNLKGHIQPDLIGLGMHWNRTLGTGVQHNRVSVNYGLTECSFMAHQHQTEPHLFSRKCGLDSPAKFRGHGNCGLTVCVPEQQLASVREEPNASETNESGFASHNSNFDSILCTSNGIRDLNGPSLVQEIMLSTKDVRSPNPRTFRQGKVDLNRKTLSSEQSQKAIQDQIQKVVVNLEEVLHGLKEIHLEMKEVVHQIDRLTADIDTDEKEPGGAPFSSGMETGCESESLRYNVPSYEDKKMCLSNKDHLSCTNAPPAYSVKDQVRQLGSTQEKSDSQKHDLRTGAGRRGLKPPPYPYANPSGKVNLKAREKGQKAPPYPFRRRLLSTIV